MAVWLEDTAELGQVRVETGTGLVAEVAPTPGGRNAKITIRATHANLQDPVVGWADMSDSAVWPTCQQAADGHFEIEYRIEVKRKPSADKATPIADLAKRDKIRELAAIARKGELSHTDTTPPASAAPDEPTAPPAEEPPPPRRGPRVEEGRPWELYNTDRSLNLGSYSYRGTVEMVELAHELTVAHDAELVEAGEFNLRKVEGLAKTLLEVADHVQAETRADGHVDRMDASHRRARYAVRSALVLHPVPWGADADTRKAWADRLANHATGILHISLNLFRFHETGEAR